MVARMNFLKWCMNVNFEELGYDEPFEQNIP